jgi:hypothetical protein
VDDTLCIGEATTENLWAMKSSLRGFELASGLKVNFWKNCLIGENIPLEFLQMASADGLGIPLRLNTRFLKLSNWSNTIYLFGFTSRG